jgi:hypothetical protein
LPPLRQTTNPLPSGPASTIGSSKVSRAASVAGVVNVVPSSDRV